MREAESGTCVVELLCDAICVVLLKVVMLCDVVVRVCPREDKSCNCEWYGEQERVIGDGGAEWE